LNAERTTARATQPPKRSFFLVRLNEVVKDSFWIVPSLFLVAAVVLGYSLRALDDRLAISAAERRRPPLLHQLELLIAAVRARQGDEHEQRAWLESDPLCGG
jgi:hypothetical protein